MAHFGAPVHNLLPHLQPEPHIHDKRKPRSKDDPGIYLGHSPVHARTVGLVLDLKTRLASPQFHIQVDDNFDTVDKTDQVICSTWLTKTGLKWISSFHASRNDNTSNQVIDNYTTINKLNNDIEEATAKTVENELIPPLHRSMRTRTQTIRLTYAQAQVLKEE